MIRCDNSNLIECKKETPKSQTHDCTTDYLLPCPCATEELHLKPISWHIYLFIFSG